MYIIFEQKIGTIQIGFRSLSESNLFHGISFSEGYFQNYGLNICSDIYIFQSNKPLFKNGTYFTKDYRFQIGSPFLKKGIILGFDFLFSIKKILKNKKNRIKLIVLKWILFVFIFPLFFGKMFFLSSKIKSNFVSQDEESLLSDIQNSEWDQEKFVDFFLNTKLANDISKNKNSFYSIQSLKIKGISEFKSIPLVKKTDEKYEYRGYFATNYKRIISFSSNQKVYFKYPEISCDVNESQKIFIFQISQDDILLLLKENEKIGSFQSEEAYIFSENYFPKEKICEYFKKNQSL